MGENFTVIFRKLVALVLAVLLILSLGFAAAAQKDNACVQRTVPQLTDILAKTKIKFVHTAAPEKKYIVESMSGGVLLLDYDRDGWLDIYFPNAPTVEMVLKGERSRSALYRNNGDGTFTDVSD